VYEQYGFQAPAERLATSADEAVQLTGEIGFPVVLKIASPDILHKTDMGGVMLNLRSADEVRQRGPEVQAAGTIG
jgi:acyl-CoA synthetase (NDP forming)